MLTLLASSTVQLFGLFAELPDEVVKAERLQLWPGMATSRSVGWPRETEEIKGKSKAFIMGEAGRLQSPSWLQCRSTFSSKDSHWNVCFAGNVTREGGRSSA
jgi:hypothetical protein